jgi:5-formyltetrahydrofolate cyclo-ligase
VDQRPGALIAEQKRVLRAALQARREALSAADRAMLGHRITDVLLDLPAYGAARVVLAYMSIGAEFDTGPFTRQVLAHRKTLVLPRVNRPERQLDLYVVDDLRVQVAPGLWDIPEPDAARCQPAALDEIDFALVPGVGFDVGGGRLGYGGGYYDRLLVDLPTATPRLAAAFSVQLVGAVPMGLRDQRVDLIVTENGPIEIPR